jgi:hypothetical protein
MLEPNGVGGTVGFTAVVIYAIINALNKTLLVLATGLRGWLVVQLLSSDEFRCRAILQPAPVSFKWMLLIKSMWLDQ